MQSIQGSDPESRSGASSDRAPAQPESGGERWRAPVITRLTLDRTLFNSGTQTDGASGSGTPV